MFPPGAWLSAFFCCSRRQVAPHMHPSSCLWLMRTRPDKTLCFLPRGGGGEGDESTASWGAKVSGFGCCMLTKGLFFGRETIHRHRRAQGFLPEEAAPPRHEHFCGLCSWREISSGAVAHASCRNRFHGNLAFGAVA
jgi:hypothetical protein